MRQGEIEMSPRQSQKVRNKTLSLPLFRSQGGRGKEGCSMLSSSQNGENEDLMKKSFQQANLWIWWKTAAQNGLFYRLSAPFGAKTGKITHISTAEIVENSILFLVCSCCTKRLSAAFFLPENIRLRGVRLHVRDSANALILPSALAGVRGGSRRRFACTFYRGMITFDAPQHLSCPSVFHPCDGHSDRSA